MSNLFYRLHHICHIQEILKSHTKFFTLESGKHNQTRIRENCGIQFWRKNHFNGFYRRLIRFNEINRILQRQNFERVITKSRKFTLCVCNVVVIACFIFKPDLEILVTKKVALVKQLIFATHGTNMLFKQIYDELLGNLAITDIHLK